MVVSSANKMESIEVDKVGKSFIATRNSIGHNKDPCGTPLLINNGLEVSEPVLTTCVLFSSQLLRSDNGRSLIPLRSSFFEEDSVINGIKSLPQINEYIHSIQYII